MPLILTNGYDATIIDGKYAVDYVSIAQRQRQVLLSEASQTIADWRTELQLGTITDDDKASLTKWMAYIKELKELDLAGITDETSYNATKWPDKPE